MGSIRPLCYRPRHGQAPPDLRPHAAARHHHAEPISAEDPLRHRGVVTKGGEVVSKHDWGLRPTAYELHKKTEAEYHLIQFHAHAGAARAAARTLRITDGVERFRIIRLAAGHPAAAGSPRRGHPEQAAPVACCGRSR